MVTTDVLHQAHGGELIARLAHLHELTVEQAGAVVDSVVPELSAFIERNTLSRGGLADLIGAIGHGHHEAYLDDPSLVGDPQAIADGNAILSHITGSKDRSRGVADRAARATGIDAGIIRDMLPSITGLMMGALSKQLKGGLGDIATRAGGGFLPKQPLPQGRPYQPPPHEPAPRGGGSGGWGQDQGRSQRQSDDGNVRSKPGGGLQLPDSLPRGEPRDHGGGDGHPRGGAGEPLPMPGNRVPQVPGNADNPFGDLAEILRRGLGLPGGSGGPIIIPLPGGGSFPFPMPGGGGQGGGQGGGMQMPRGETGGGGFPWPQGGGQQSPLPMPGGNRGGGPLPMPGGGGRGIELPGGQVGGGMLWNVIRSILGSALGFQNKGIMSWILRAVLMRYGWPILRTILGRGLFGR